MEPSDVKALGRAGGYQTQAAGYRAFIPAPQHPEQWAGVHRLPSVAGTARRMYAPRPLRLNVRPLGVEVECNPVTVALYLPIAPRWLQAERPNPGSRRDQRPDDLACCQQGECPEGRADDSEHPSDLGDCSATRIGDA